MSNEKQNSTPENTTTDSAEVVPKPSLKNRITTYIKDNPTIAMAGLAIFILLFVIFMFLYFTYLYQSPIEKFADKFCDCAEDAKSEYYTYAKDGFGYRSDLNGCFAEEFRAYGEDFDKMEKKRLLEQFQKEVILRCPEKLANVFDNQ